MKVISIASAKGGVGKSTLAVNLACAILEEGRSVAILDLDPQGSALLWQQLRTKSNPEASAPAVQAASVEALGQQLLALASRRVDFVVLDMPGYSSEELNRALRHCDIVLVPSRASIIDIAPATETVKAAMQLGKTFCYVMNFVPPEDQSAFRSVKNELETAGFLVCPVAIPASEAFPVAFASGKSVTEHEPHGKAAKEIRWLLRFVRGLV